METANTTSHPGLSNAQRRKMVFHAFCVIGMGLIGGMGWVIILGGYLQLWPTPPIELDLPENKELWRNAHIGPIMNGIFLLAITAVSPLLDLSARQAKWLFWTGIIMVWFNTFGYQIAPFASDRGLAPIGDFANVITYFFFYIAALCAFVVVGIGAYSAYGRRSD